MNQTTAGKRTSAAAATAAEPVENELYAKHKKVYPRQVHGLFANLRILGVVVLLGLYYGIPWIQYEGRQSVLFDLPARKFYIFEWVFWPQDFFYLALLLIIAAVSLFFFTAVAGRLWCGYACPQTVWTEVFLWMERKIEGGRPQQMKLDQQPLNARKIRIKATKHLAWILFSAWTGFTFVGFFTPIRELGAELVAFNLGPWETFWIVFYSFATYGNAGWMREQVCIYMCPYARFQSAMFDKDTLIISYDEGRGEPRGSRKRNVDHEELGLGDCIDCTLCVQVCPTGIDIRDGLQYQCIGCAACIDVCDQVMDKMGYPRGLIRYTTEHALEDRPTRLLRPRVIIYATILLALLAALFTAIAQRVPAELDIIRDRNALYRVTSEGRIENAYTLRIINMEDSTRGFTLSVSGLPGVSMRGTEGALQLEPGQVVSLPVQLRVPRTSVERVSSPVTFVLESQDGEVRVEREARFLGPVPGSD